MQLMEEVKESHAAGVRKGVEWTRTLNKPDQVEETTVLQRPSKGFYIFP